jgi:cobalt-precorrin 5A hydrolase
MKISLTAFTDRGEALAVRITKQLNNDGEQAEFVRCGRRPLPADSALACPNDEALRPLEHAAYVRAADWTGKVFGESDALVFVGAAGIAVRSIAPHLASKTTDPAVIVIDEAGRFVIPILSGHLGGANALTLCLASITCGQAVITTATDVNGVFAFDDWARRMNCAVENADLIKEVSGTLLGGGIVPVCSDFEILGEVPRGVELCSYTEASVCVTICEESRVKPCIIFRDETGAGQRVAIRDETGAGQRIAIRDEMRADPCEDACVNCETDGVPAPSEKNRARKLRIIPRIVCVGIGCRRGTSAEEIEEAVMEALRENGISPKALCALASIDLKAEEEGIKELARKYKVPFLTYSAEELCEVPGEFTGSDFVKSVTGVDNVCERAAMRAASLIEPPRGAECSTAVESDRGSMAYHYGELICRKRAKDGVTVALARRTADLNWEL